MDSDSYLIKIIRSGSDRTADSLYLQTTIGSGIRWPIVLLVSTVVAVTSTVAFLIWTQIIRRPRNLRSRQKSESGDCPKIVISTPTPNETSSDQVLSHSTPEQPPFTFKGHLGSEHTQKTNPNSRMVVHENNSIFSTKRRVSWASFNSVKHIPSRKRHRRHSSVTLESRKYLPSVETSRRYSFSDIPSSKSPVGAVANDTALRFSNPSELHLQISKTIAVLDNLNKTLQENNEVSDLQDVIKGHNSIRLIESQKRVLKKKKIASQNHLKPLTRNLEELLSDSGSPLLERKKSENQKCQDFRNERDIDNLVDVKFDLFCGQN